MKSWLIEPRDPLVVRDGRPIGDTGLMRSVSFPWPSTMAGAIRSYAGTNADGIFKSTPAAAKQIPVHGPLLAELGPDGAIMDFLLPTPKDCVFFGAGANPDAVRHRLLPKAPEAGHVTDLGTELLPTLCGPAPKGKPLAGPAFWRWAHFSEWLTAPKDAARSGDDVGIKCIEHERRSHVSITPDTDTASDGMLFTTDALRFTTGVRSRLALVVRTGADLRPGVIFVGGERRISSLRQAATLPWQNAPEHFEVGANRLARVVLLTPGIFANGCAPRSLGEGTRIVSWCVARPETISGWDFAPTRPDSPPGPKPSRRMAPAGSVYWVDLGKVDPAEWARNLWMNCISDSPQDRLDGFGLAVVGVG